MSTDGALEAGGSSFQKRVRHALGLIEGALLVDGYALRFTAIEPSELGIVIFAGPEACPDCLVPREVLVDSLRDSLAGEGIEMADASISIAYPGESLRALVSNKESGLGDLAHSPDESGEA